MFFLQTTIKVSDLSELFFWSPGHVVNLGKKQPAISRPQHECCIALKFTHQVNRAFKLSLPQSLRALMKCRHDIWQSMAWMVSHPKSLYFLQEPHRHYPYWLHSRRDSDLSSHENRSETSESHRQTLPHHWPPLVTLHCGNSISELNSLFKGKGSFGSSLSNFNLWFFGALGLWRQQLYVVEKSCPLCGVCEAKRERKGRTYRPHQQHAW